MGNIRHPHRRSDNGSNRSRRQNHKQAPPSRASRIDHRLTAQRVAVAIDVQNLYYGAKSLYGTKVAYEKFLDRALNNRKMVRSIAYIANRDGNNQGSFIKLMRSIGCDIRCKQVIEHSNGMKCNWDVEIAIDAVALAPKIDTFILASGDGDFTYLLKTLRMMGVRTEVIAFRPNTSHMLIEEADDYQDITREMLIDTSQAWRNREERDNREESDDADEDEESGDVDEEEPREDEESKPNLVCPKCERAMKSSSGYKLHVKKCCPELVSI